ncbi:MAG: DUF1761 domain-containing protein [Saprospiraceae bacterium]|nr:DUF1761 domain-containing protein [Saprospiraceae bacterium]
MQFNWHVLFIAALVPLVVGFAWYHPKVFGRTWMAAAGMTEAPARGANMVKLLGLTYLFGLLAASALMPLTIHQLGFYSVLADEPGFRDPQSEIGQFASGFMDKYGHNFRTFRHGAFHGLITGIFLALPVSGTIALYERKGFAYIAVNVGFWMLCFAIMGGMVCAWA